jgi:hypothetical protein
MWMQAHPQEVLLIDFNHFYNFDASLHAHLQTLIKTKLATRLHPCCALPDLTLAKVWPHQAIVFYQPKAEDNIDS